MSSEKKVMISVECGDGKTLKVDEATAFMSELIKSDIMRARSVDASVSESTKFAMVHGDIMMQKRMRHKDWPNVVLDRNLCRIPSDFLEKVFQYCEAHADADADLDDLHAFDRQFLHAADPQLLRDLIKAALVLRIEGLCEFAHIAFNNRMDEIGADLEEFNRYANASF